MGAYIMEYLIIGSAVLLWALELNELDKILH